MQVPLQISYRHCDSSEALNARVAGYAAELEQFYPRITGCQVLVERPGQHHRKGKGAHYRVRIELTVPGKVLVVSRDPQAHRPYEDPYLAVHESFDEMRRQLQDFVRQRRGEVKTLTHAPHGHVIELNVHDGFGFLRSADGRDIYFHRESVLDGGFDRLTLGAEVRFAEEEGEKGPQASSVQLVGAAGHHEIPRRVPLVRHSLT